MKKQILALAIVLSSITAIFASNNPATSTLTLMPNETSFIIDVTALEGAAMYVSVADKNGNFIFTDYIESKKERIKYVLDKFQAGTYTVKIKGEETVEYYTINHNGTSVSLIEKETFTSPSITKEANKVIVQASNVDQGELTFSIFDRNGDNIYNSNGFSQKVFNLNKLDNGTYRILVSDNEFSKELFVSL